MDVTDFCTQRTQPICTRSTSLSEREFAHCSCRCYKENKTLVRNTRRLEIFHYSLVYGLGSLLGTSNVR